MDVLNHTLSVNDFLVINGFSDLLTPFLGAAGAEAGATGWWSNLRTFSLERFSPPIGGGRTPTERYLSCALLNRVTYYELDILRRRVRSVLNRLGTDDLYAWDGSQPPRNKEILQTWDAIKALNQALVSTEGGGIPTSLREGYTNRPRHIRVDQPASRGARSQVRRFSLGPDG